MDIDKKPEVSESEKQDLNRVDENRFTRELDNLIKESEDMRISRMRQYRTRSFLALNLSILSMLLGSAGFGWFFLMATNIPFALGILIGSVIPAILLHLWAGTPLKTYITEHKSVFMPKMAKTLNGFTFHENRGVSASILNKLGVIPAYDRYEAEDCFMGTYKGVKVMFSEARLHSKARDKAPVFDGIFVLLQTPEDVFEGHTIISANRRMVKAYANTRWNKMQQVSIPVSNQDWNIFDIYSTKPQSAELVIGEKLIKELAEAADIFDKAPLTAVMFGKKNVFMMIPYAHDMFEASNLFVPITTKKQAMRCKQEIEQLLEIIDVFDIYKPIEQS